MVLSTSREQVLDRLKVLCAAQPDRNVTRTLKALLADLGPDTTDDEALSRLDTRLQEILPGAVQRLTDANLLDDSLATALLSEYPRLFVPWVGSKYEDGFQPFEGVRLKLLILGESHYDAIQHPAFTREVVRRQWGEGTVSGGRLRFFRSIEAMLGSEQLKGIECEQFYASVAFYNYVTTSMEDSGQRPRRSEFLDSYPGFLSVVSALQPDIVVVTGFVLWDHLPERGVQRPFRKLSTQPLCQSPTGSRRELMLWEIGEAGPLVFPVEHPASRTFGSADRWKPWVDAGLQACVEALRHR